MDKNVLVRLLKHRVNELENELNSIGQSDQIHQIDIDILLSKLRMLYDDVKLLQPNQNSDNESAGETTVYSETANTHEPVPVPEPVPVSVPVVEKETELFHVPEPESAIIPEPVHEHVPVPEPEIAPEQPIDSVPPTASKSFLDQELTETPRSTLLKEPKEKLLTSTKMQAVDDIMVAIGLNDRFLFIRELFNNDSDLFKSTILTLNNSNNWEEAVNYLDDNFSWNSEDPTLVLFLSFLKRRFI